MPRAYRKRRPTRELILKTGMRMFLELGYTETSCNSIAKQLNISPGNLTFYFPTKEHLLTQLVEHLSTFQRETLSSDSSDPESLIHSYCLELATMSALCESSATIRNFYISAYVHPMSLNIIRNHDILKAKRVFADYCPEYTDQDFTCAENLVSGIEYATLAAETSNTITRAEKIRWALDSILQIYHVPEALRSRAIVRVLAADYPEAGEKMIQGFMDHLEHLNATAVQEANAYIAARKNTSAK